MPFYLFKYESISKSHEIKEEYFEKIKNVSLAGYNTIYNLWNKKEKPINTGWHANLDEIISEITNGKEDSNSRRLVIDFDPKADWRIALVEIINLYAYTYGNSSKEEVWWTPFMLELQEVWVDEELEKKLSPKEKGKLISSFTISNRRIDADSIVEFIYLNGDRGGWNFGRVGGANAAFIFGDARKYFRQFF